MEVCTLSCRGDRFIPYPLHYKEAFAFSIFLYLLQHQITLRSSLSAIQPDAMSGLPRSVQVTELGRFCLFAGDTDVSVSAPSKRTTDHIKPYRHCKRPVQLYDV